MCRYPMLAIKKYNCKINKYEIKIIGKQNVDEDYTKLKIALSVRSEKLITIPCGKCIDCRLQRSREWADRCMLETKDHKYNYFVTLTYDNDNLPKGKKIDIETGEVTQTPTLEPKHLQDFFKRLRITYKRKYNIDTIRYYACGEYGDKYQRPHYHAIIFGLPIYDLKTDHKSKKGNMNYNSKEIQDIWGKGRIAVGNVTWDSCAYTARYIMKKQLGKDNQEYYKVAGKAPEFVRMSRRPGIARKYYDEKSNIIYETDEIWLNTNRGVKSAKPPRYYDKLFDLENHEQLEEIKRRRKENAENRQKILLMNTDLKASDLLKTKNKSKDTSIKTLKRNFESGKNMFI